MVYGIGGTVGIVSANRVTPYTRERQRMRGRNVPAVRLALVLCMIAVVASCSRSVQPYRPVAVPQDITQGSTFVLLDPIPVPKGMSAVFFQRGGVLHKDKISGDAPVCRLDLAKPTAKRITIQPQNFRVTDVEYDDRSEGADEQKATTSFALKAAAGPTTKRMACGRPLDSTKVDFLTPDEIAAALNGLFLIRAPN
jgi:hypothetical protein